MSPELADMQELSPAYCCIMISAFGSLMMRHYGLGLIISIDADSRFTGQTRYITAARCGRTDIYGSALIYRDATILASRSPSVSALQQAYQLDALPKAYLQARYVVKSYMGLLALQVVLGVLQRG